MPPTPDGGEILVIKLGAFGDVIQAEGAIHDIRDHHPDATLTLLTGPAYRGIFERCPWVDRILIDRREPRWRLDRMLALARTVRFGRFDRVYDLQNSSRTRFYFRWFGHGVEWSGTAPGCSLPATYPPQQRSTLPILDKLANQLQAAGLETRHTHRPDLVWMADDMDETLRQAQVPTPFVVLLAGASAAHPEKIWPHYPALARRLLERGLGVVTVPGPGEAERFRAIPGTMLTGGERGFLDFFQLAGVLRRACFAIGNDTGPSHLAAHLGVPGLALFGGHTSAAKTSIRREWFDCIEVDDLAALPLERVLAEVERRLP